MQRSNGVSQQIPLCVERVERHPLSVEGFDQEQISYHVYRMGNSNLLVTAVTTNMISRVPSAIPIHLTWKGHDFIDAHPERYDLAQCGMATEGIGGSVSIMVFKHLLDARQRVSWV